MSYMLNKNGNEPMFAQCPKAAQPDHAAYQREEEICTKEEIVKTPIIRIFDQIQKKTLGFRQQMNKLGGFVQRNGDEDNLQGSSEPICLKEQGYCVTSSGRDQNSGVKKLNGWKVWDDELNKESGGTLKGQRRA